MDNTLFRHAEFWFLYAAVPVLLIFTEDSFPLLATLWVIVAVVSICGIINARIIPTPKRLVQYFPELATIAPPKEWWRMLTLVTVIAVTSSLLLAQAYPDSFLSFPLNHTGTWLFLLLVYPVVSVLPQQLIFNFYLSRRHRQWWKGWGSYQTSFIIVVTGILFAWAHILFANWFAVGATFLGGMLFSWRYQRTKSLPLTIAEHALYGNLFFTIGLGSFLDSAAV